MVVTKFQNSPATDTPAQVSVNEQVFCLSSGMELDVSHHGIWSGFLKELVYL